VDGERQSLDRFDGYDAAAAAVQAKETELSNPALSDAARAQVQAELTQFQAEQTTLDHCISKVLDSESTWVDNCVANDTSNATDLTKFQQCSDQIETARAASEIMDIDAMNCVRAEEFKSSSVMDYHGKFNGRYGGLGKYDRAAIKFGYAQIVEEFKEEALQNIAADDDDDSIREWLWYNDYKKIPDELVNGPAGLKDRVNKYRPWSATQTRWTPAALEVPYGFCSDEYAYAGWLQGTDVCRIRDWGANHREQMAHDLLRYKKYYFFSQFARGRLDWNIGAAIDSNAGIFDKVLLTFQYMYFYRAYNPAFFDTDLGKDFLAASQAGLDLYSEVLAQPEQGFFLHSAGSNAFTVDSRVRGRWMVTSTEDYLDLSPDQINQADNTGSGVMLPNYYYGECEWYGDGFCGISGPQYSGFVCNNTVGRCDVLDLPLGDGRPSFLNFTNDYEDWFFTYVGNYFDKTNVLFNLVLSQAYFPKLTDFTVEENAQLARISLSSLFGDTIRRTLYSIITNRPKDYASIYRPSVGFVPRSFSALDPAARELQPGDVYILPRRITNLPYLAMAYGMIFQSTVDDGVLDFASVGQIGVKGEEDDIQGWDTLGAENRAEFTHPLSGVTYRAARVGDYPVAYDLVLAAERHAEKYLALKECTDNPSKNDGVCACTYVGKFYTDDKDGNGSISGTASGSETDECILMEPENGLKACERRSEPCAGADRVDLRDNAFERMEQQVETLENLRGFYQAFANGVRLN
jgi:hypothetical protein